MSKIDPTDPSVHGKPLWVVYGSSAFPEIICAKLRAYAQNHTLLPLGARGHHVCIWGYSVWKGEPGFRTLGVDVAVWAKQSHSKPVFFDEQSEALEHLRKLLTPKRGAS